MVRYCQGMKVPLAEGGVQEVGVKEGLASLGCFGGREVYTEPWLLYQLWEFEEGKGY